MITNHTEGPWETTAGPKETDFGVCMPGGGDLIAEIYTENFADAQLMATAPNLLKACDLVQRAWSGDGVELSEAVDACLLAIIEAKGE